MTKFGKLVDSTKRNLIEIVSKNLDKPTQELSQILNENNPSVCLDINQVAWLKGYVRRMENVGKSIKY